MNTMSYDQVYSIMNEILAQSQGTQSIRAVDTASFIACGTTVLEKGVDSAINAISVVLSKTLWDNRPYNRKFKGMQMDSIRFGNFVRKITIVDGTFEQDKRLPLTDGQSVDPFTINKPKALQTNWYGIDVYEKSVTIFKDQLDVAFSSEAEFGRFISLVYSNIRDQFEKAYEETARATLANMIGAKVKSDAKNVYYLFDEYYTATGISLTSATYRDPQYYMDFCKWAFGFINTISDFMEERSAKYHINLPGKTIMKHTPKNKQKMYLYSPEINQVSARIYSSVFSPEFLKYVDFEKVNFWQNIDDPAKIIVKPSYTNSGDGTVVEEEDSITVNNIFGVLFDEDACGYTRINNWSAPSPFNPKGGYTNVFWHESLRPWNSLFENFVVFILDNKPTFDLTVTKGTHTTITITKNGTSMSATTASDAIALGDLITITATAGSGYDLTTFTVNGDDETSPVTLYADADLTIVTAATENV